MERVQVLIDKLIEQKRANESPAQMLITVQLLQSELQNLQQKKGHLGTSKVAVVLPNSTVVNRQQEEVKIPQAEVKPAFEDTRYMPQENLQPPTVEQPKAEEQKEIYTLDLSEDEEEKASIVEERVPEIKPQPQPFYSQHDVISESPTFIQHQPHKEVHEIISEKKESLNDKLKEDKKELAHLLKDTPVKDLRKAIGINDKFLFLNELFRGDEAMYERSIKTINGFRILSEAEYWINRELKVKLGWNDNKDTVQHFYHLVRRRFS